MQIRYGPVEYVYLECRIHVCSRSCSRQTIEVGGLLHELGGVRAVDKKLDSDPVANHHFLQQRATLIKHKQQNPNSRITSQTNPLVREEVDVKEERITGLRGPPVKFMELSHYEKRFGAAPPDKVRTNVINGAVVTGVDIVEEEEWGPGQ